MHIHPRIRVSEDPKVVLDLARWKVLLTLVRMNRGQDASWERGIRGLGFGSEGEHLPSIYEALGLVPSTGVAGRGLR